MNGDRNKKSEYRFARAMEAMGDGVYDWDVVTNTVVFSPSYYTMAGYEVGDFPMEFESWACRVNPLDMPQVQSAVDAFMSGRSKEYQVPFRFLRKDGSWMWTLARAKIVERDDDGSPLRVIGAHSNIEELAHTQAALRQAQKMDSLGKLAAGVAHDFNNLLFVVKASAELLLAEGGLTDAQGGLTTEILTASQHGRDLVARLLNFAYEREPRKEPFSLHDVVENSVALLGRILPSQVDVSTKLDSSASGLIGDPIIIESAILNLAINASDAMPRGGSLRISTIPVPSPEGRQDSFVELHISDTGVGMPPEVLERIYEPFFTTKGVGMGTGLGLATVLRAVQEHGGELSVTTEEGQGTVFVLKFPLHSTSS
jgi:two-component system cell cycle sensor histidine kinase/response regulator CckA